MSTLAALLAVTTPVSALGGALSTLLLTRGRWRVDDFTARKIKRELEADDEKRNRERMEADLARADALRREMAILTERNNEYFAVILELQETVSDLNQVVHALRDWASIVISETRAREVQLPPLPATRIDMRRRAGREGTAETPA